MSRSCAVWLVALAAALPAPTFAAHTTFTGAVARFEADGNVFGPADGAPDLVDEFDDGDLAPAWTRLLGTSYESAGVLMLRDPGADIALVPGIAFRVKARNVTISPPPTAVRIALGLGGGAGGRAAACAQLDIACHQAGGGTARRCR